MATDNEKLQDAIDLIQYIAEHPQGYQWSKLINKHVVPLIREVKENKNDRRETV